MDTKIKNICLQLEKTKTLACEYSKQFSKDFKDELEYLNGANPCPSPIPQQYSAPKIFLLGPQKSISHEKPSITQIAPWTFQAHTRVKPPTLKINTDIILAKFIKKLYYRLAKKLHPDIEPDACISQDFTSVTQAYKTIDFYKLIFFARKYNIKLPHISEELLPRIICLIEQAETQIRCLKNTASWLWGISLIKNDVLRKQMYEHLGVKRNKFEKWYQKRNKK